MDKSADRYAELGRSVAVHVDHFNRNIQSRNGWEVAQIAAELNRLASDVLAECAIMPGRVAPVLIPLRGTDTAEDKLVRVLRAVHLAMFPGSDPVDSRKCIECGINHPQATISVLRK
jgi:hypothetical protein